MPSFKLFSTSFNLRLDIAKPVGAYVKLFYKTLLQGETADLTVKEYTEMTGLVIPDSLGGEYFEVTKQIVSLSAFQSIIFKIVLRGCHIFFIDPKRASQEPPSRSFPAGASQEFDGSDFPAH